MIICKSGWCGRNKIISLCLTYKMTWEVWILHQDGYLCIHQSRNEYDAGLFFTAYCLQPIKEQS